MQQAPVYTMRNYFDAVEAGKASARGDRQFQQQDQMNQMKIAQGQKQMAQANALEGIDPNNLDPNKLWEAGQHDMAIKLVQSKIDNSTNQLQKIGQFLRDNVKDQESYDKAIQFVKSNVPDAEKYLAMIPTVYDPQQVNMFVSYVDQAVNTKPQLQLVEQADRSIKVVDIAREQGNVVGGKAPEQGLTHDALGRIVPYTKTGDGFKFDKPVGPVRPSSENSGLSKSQERTNQSIINARRKLQQMGLSKSEVLRRTQAATATGRENPDYDPQLNTIVRLANQRMYGDDPQHDSYMQDSSMGSVYGNQLSFNSEAEANAAIRSGKVKSGQTITVNGRKASVP